MKSSEHGLTKAELELLRDLELADEEVKQGKVTPFESAMEELREQLNLNRS